jgi:hypothetical protein
VEYSLQQLQELLTAPGPVFWNEVLANSQSTKLYFDYDCYLDQPPSQDELLVHQNTCVDAVAKVVQVHARSDTPTPDIALAQRHGPVNKRGETKFKVSFHAFVTNVAIDNYTRIPALIKQARVTEHLDLSVYKPKEQLLNLVGCCKSPMDLRTLQPCPTDAARELHNFLASWLTGTEVLVVATEVSAGLSTQTRAAAAPLSLNSSSHNFEQVKTLLASLAPARWANRDTWIAIGIALKNSGVCQNGNPDLYKQLFLDFSRNAAPHKFTDEVTEGKTWDSLCNSPHDGPALSLRSIQTWAAEDAPEVAPAIYKALATVGFSTEAITLLPQPDTGHFSFQALCPLAGNKCPCCQSRPSHLAQRWFVSVDVAGEDPDLQRVSLRADHTGCCDRIIGPLKDFLETNLRASRLPELLGAQRIEVQQSEPDDTPTLLAKHSNGNTAATMQLPLTDVSFGDGRQSNVLDVIGQPQLPRMVIKGGADAHGWNGNLLSSQEMVAVNPTNTPAARLVCDWDHPPFGRLERATLTFPGTSRRVVISERDKADLAKIQSTVTQALVQHVADTLQVDELVARTLLNYNVFHNVQQVNINNTINNNHFANPAADDSSTRPTKLLADILLDNGAFTNSIEIAPNDYAIFNTSTGIWSLKRTRDNAAAVASDIVKAWTTERPDLFAPKEFRHLLAGTNMQTVLRCIAGKLEQDNVIHKFDEIVPTGSVPFRNGMFMAALQGVRPLVKEDLVTASVGYNFVPFDQIRQEDAQFVDDFYARVFPVSEERRIFQQLLGFALFGNAASKHFLLLTDLRDGYNGKSTLMKFVARTFGDLGRKDRQVLVCERQEDPNAHQTGMLAFKAKRLCWVEEPSEHSKIDIAKLKDLSGGRATFEGRALHSAVNVKFTWRALIVITANENALPIMEAAGDLAFLKRLVAINMRAKFVEPGHPELSHPNTFVADSTVEQRLEDSGCLAAHVRVLFQAYTEFVDSGAAVTLPPDSQAFLDSIVIQADPLMEHALEFVDSNCRVEQGAFVRKTEVERRFQDFLDGEAHTMHFNKQRRQRNKVLKAAMTKRNYKFHLDTLLNGQRVTNGFVNMAWLE